ncbi:universal stress protein [Kitasatospora sp. NPDC087315]|uniref:universal stress protein n=1 Tax=Kitasatospora sp. NPDC087315 TaxID=3364069 RepID=UPI00380EC9E0
MLAFAFEEASVCSVPLRVVHAWSPPGGRAHLSFGSGGGQEKDLAAAEERALAQIPAPWRERCPNVEVATALVSGSPEVALVESASRAGLLVVGRHVRRVPVGPHLGAVAHAAIHHALCPVAVVPFS